MTILNLKSERKRCQCPTRTTWRRLAHYFIANCFFLFYCADSAFTAKRQTRRFLGAGGGGGVTKYDRSITTFSDNGRLLQVEYGMEASNRGKSVACLRWEWGAFSAICVAVVVNDNDNDNDNDNNVRQDADSSSSSVASSTEDEDKVHRVDDHCLLFTTGLAGDGRLLARASRIECLRARLMYGEVPTVQDCAHALARFQHRLTRMAGIRPAGVTATVVGVDPTPTFNDDDDDDDFVVEWEEEDADADASVVEDSADDEENQHEHEGVNEEDKEEEDAVKTTIGKPRLFQSEPGGVLEECFVCAAGKDRVRLEAELAQLSNSLDQMATSSSSSSLESNSAPQETQRWIGEMAHGVSQTIFGGGGDTVRNKNTRLDLWIIEADAKRKGGIRIRCAKGLCRADLNRINTMFNDAKDDSFE